MKCAGFAFLFFACALSCTTGNKPVVFVIDNTEVYSPVLKLKPGNQHQKSITGKEWNNISALFLVVNGKPATSPVALKRAFKNDTLYSSPYSWLGSGLVFEWQVYAGDDTLKERFTTPVSVQTGSLARVEQFYPSADTLPSNILMFHVHFDQPMNESELAFKSVHVFDEAGKEKNLVWRQKSAWVDGGKHLVLVVHPGRIKRGIRFMEEEGELFEEGKTYTFEIKGLTDIHRREMAGVFRKKVHIGKADRVSPSFKNAVKIPGKGTLDPLIISFSEIMDLGGIETGLLVKDRSGIPVKGIFRSAGGVNWEFIPETLWQQQPYTLVLNDHLADLAGNHTGRRFEEGTLNKLKDGAGKDISFVPR